MGKKAVLFGASGVTGSLLLKELISDDKFDEVILFNRRNLNIESSKVTEIITDLFDIDSYSEAISADVMYCNIGSTQKKTPDKNLYEKIDRGIPAAAARLAKRNNIEKFMVISSLGANSKSSNFYPRMKGQMEDDVKSAGIKNTYILQPSLINSDREESRIGEKIAIVLAKLINPLLVGGAKKYRSIHASVIAKAMRSLAFQDLGVITIESDKLQEIGSK